MARRAPRRFSYVKTAKIPASERIIGVTIVAIGTSLPELVTTVTAIVKKQSSLSVGNILGANIIDLTLILPLSAFVSGKALPIAEIFFFSSPPSSAFMERLAEATFSHKNKIFQKFQKWQGILLLAVYAGYLFLTLGAV